jgi:hypothetical protein
MSDGFNPYQPQATGRGNNLLPGQRPAVATVFGILNLVFGIIGVCSSLAVVSGFTFLFNVLDAKTRAQMKLDESMQQFNDPTFFGLFVMQMVLGTILSGVIIASGIGLLKFKPWGRKFANFYAIAYLILLVVGVSINVIFTLIPAVNEANNPGASPDKIGAAVGGAVGGVFSVCFGVIYPICILIFLNRRAFVDQIEGR